MALPRSQLLWCLVATIVAVPRAVAGQAAELTLQPLLGSTFSADVLRDLPTSGSPFAVLETVPEVTADRFSSSGLNVASAPRFGAFLNSWSQTQFRIGDVN